jgi:hypothetical protein
LQKNGSYVLDVLDAESVAASKDSVTSWASSFLVKRIGNTVKTLLWLRSPTPISQIPSPQLDPDLQPRFSVRFLWTGRWYIPKAQKLVPEALDHVSAVNICCYFRYCVYYMDVYKYLCVSLSCAHFTAGQALISKMWHAQWRDTLPIGIYWLPWCLMQSILAGEHRNNGGCVNSTTPTLRLVGYNVWVVPVARVERDMPFSCKHKLSPVYDGLSNLREMVCDAEASWSCLS